MLSRNVLLTIAAASSVLAIPKGVPEAFPGALANAAEATYECHANCGYLILAARECGADGGPYDTSCLCTAGSQFENLVASCLDCGWCLWEDYGSFLSAPLSACGEPTEPTGTLCAAGASTPAPAAETTSAAPVETSSEAPVETTSSEAPAATTTSTPAPAEETTSAPVEETTSAPAEQATSAPAEETTSAPAEQTTSAPAEQTTSAPAEQTTSAPAEETTSAPAEQSTSSEAAASADDIETYSGAAEKVVIGAGSVFLGLAALLI
ncbi:unnamed protein product [[Candida] boidinii]|uniref:Unnamed protein product n=1 Tax=Candida boidinii TaxID=5477 RepID=A0A9W6WIC2_CANBO|nr:nucleotidyltransferase activity protein [[Candida] boidinii]GME71475.1 unnamed protein product [[Candida] boidinii]GMF98277.1 unnamed protein product [[Candida] boidinii]